MSDIKWIWLSDRCGAGSAEILALITRFKTIDEIYDADFDDYVSGGISERTAELLCDKNLDDAYRIIDFCRKSGVGILTFDNEKFPVSLRALPNPPAVLYYIGTLPDFNSDLFISVVGTRKMSEYGMRSAYKIAYEIASSGAVTVSGMALGIDGVVACASISAGGRTVAVLGCGIDVVYPAQHKKLRDIIAQHGAIITEYPPATRPYGYNFPVRNRIISGLGVCTLVIDAPEGSGSLITAKNAIIQGKDIYAVPGNIDGKNATGTNGLIRDGACAVSCGRDVIKNYAYCYSHCVDMQKLFTGEKRSAFNPAQLRAMGVGTRVSYSFDENTLVGNTEKNKRVDNGESSNSIDKKTKFKEKQDMMADKQSANDNVQSTASESDSDKKRGDSSDDVFKSLSKRQKDVFNAIPLDKPISADYLVKTGYSMGEVMSALTVLEIKGLVLSLPGALYVRR